MDKRAAVIAELRRQYGNKYGDTEEVRDAIDNELRSLSHKHKLSMQDLNEVEQKISVTSKAVSSVADSKRDQSPFYRKSKVAALTPRIYRKRDSMDHSPPQTSASFVEGGLDSTSPLASPRIYNSYHQELTSPLSSKLRLVQNHHPTKYEIVPRVPTDKTEAYVRLLY